MSAAGRVPFLDLVAPHLELQDELLSVFRSLLQTGAFVGGPIVEQFEHEFAQFCQAEQCVGVGSGTDALRFALMASGVRPGDVVVTVPNTFIATAEAISQTGAQPDFVDIDEHTSNMHPLRLQDYLETKCFYERSTGKLWNRATRRPVTAIIPVHLYGHVADMDAILELADKYKLIVIEDACQAHGAEYFSNKQKRWKRAGCMGHAAAFSFYPGKNLGACGEAGAVTTNDSELAARIRMLRDHGQQQKYKHEIEGYNGRLDAIQAGILLVKLKHLPKWNELRRLNALRYADLLGPLKNMTLPYESSESKSVYHLYVIRISRRERLQAYLASRQVATQIHYPIPLHLQKAYKALGYGKGDFPAAEGAASEILSLPMYPQLTLDQQQYIAKHIAEFLSMQLVLSSEEDWLAQAA